MTMRPQIGMILHYRPLDDADELAAPRPALVMGADEHNPPNLDLLVFGRSPTYRHMERVPPAETTVTGSGWAWPEWEAPEAIYVPPPSPAAMAEMVDNMRPGTVSRVAPRFDETAKPGDDRELREGQTGSVILLALGAVVVAGLLSTALGL